jgi:predicted LPLAT superfamily acyltransferase
MPTEAAARAEGSRWVGGSFGSDLQHGIFYFLIRCCGRTAAYLLLRPVVGFYMLFRPSLRSRTRPYLDRRFPGRGAIGRLLDSYRMSLGLGKALVDRAVAGILGPKAISASLSGKEELLGLLERGQGLVVVTAHVGCWQASMTALELFGRPVNMLIRSDDGEADRHWFEHAGLPAPYATIDPEGYLGGAIEMMGALKRGEVLCIMGDRMLGNPRNSTTVDFLGGAVRFPVSPYKVAAAAGAPIAFLFSAKTGPNSYEATFAGALEPPATAVGPSDIFRPETERFAAALADYVGRHPYQFFNFFDLWQADDTQD